MHYKWATLCISKMWVVGLISILNLINNIKGHLTNSSVMSKSCILFALPEVLEINRFQNYVGVNIGLLREQICHHRHLRLAVILSQSLRCKRQFLMLWRVVSPLIAVAEWVLNNRCKVLIQEGLDGPNLVDGLDWQIETASTSQSHLYLFIFYNLYN